MRKSKGSAKYLPWRFHLTLGIILFAVIGLGFRVFCLSVLDQRFLRHEGDERVLRTISTPAFRGMIVDRNGFPLAISTTVYSAWINPQAFSPSRSELKSLSEILKIPAKEISARAQSKKREFVYLKRALAPDVSSQIRELNIRGVNLQQEYKRYYPEGEVTSHVVGFTNIDDKGQEGLELGYNTWLAGEPGKKMVIKDRLGRVISDIQSVKEQKPGHDLMLSIDRRVQYLAYKELLAGVMENEAVSGSAIVLDAQTGEVLALVNQPSYNPNNRAGKTSDVFRNRAITDTFEPGSTIKAFTVATALESGKYQMHSKVNTSPGWMRVDRNVVRDEKNNGVLSLHEILQISSNMGAAKLVLSLPPNSLWSLLSNVGFGETTGVGFPGEQQGTLIDHAGNFMLATLSFGYGLAVTPLQLARAYAVLANHGVKVPISLLKVPDAPSGKRVITEKVAQDMLALLELSKQKTYRMAGKTGTARRVGEDGYEKHYNSSFVGIAPLTNPRLVVAVVINDPRGRNYYGAKVSGPVFDKIMEGALRLLDVPPDKD